MGPQQLVEGGVTSKSGGDTGKAEREASLSCRNLMLSCPPVSHMCSNIWYCPTMPSTPTPPTFTLQLFLDSPILITIFDKQICSKEAAGVVQEEKDDTHLKLW